jgi:regulator of protease activity HflC (stomatin/prohibitin superfamily)
MHPEQIFMQAFFTFVGCLIAAPILRAMLNTFGLFAVVGERQALVYTFSGKVFGVLSEPGPHCPVVELGWPALLVWIMGKCWVVDLRLDQEYLRSQPVNSEEGAPMGIGVWYEYWVSDPEAYLFRNTDPRGSLRANVSNATVRCLSNMKLADMLENRHQMSRTVRAEVSPKSHEWGFLLGSIYVRKVHFRDAGMIRQIEEKVTNRLRQVTAAIRQDGTNQVNLITSAAERQAAVEFARAAAIRPQIVGAALQQISEADPEVAAAMFGIMETQRLIDGDAEVILMPPGGGLLPTLLAAGPDSAGAVAAPPPPSRPKAPKG